MQKRTFFLLIATSVFHVSAYPTANDNSSDHPGTASRPPSASDLMEATAPGYITPAGMKSECLGRLVFDMKADVEWPTWYDKDFGFAFNKSFTHNVFNSGDQIKVGNINIAIIDPADQRINDSLNAALPKNLLIENSSRLKKDETALIASKKNKSQDKKTLYAKSKLEDSIQSAKERIKEIQDKYEPFSPGLPDSEGYGYSKVEAGSEQYSVLHANLKRGTKFYVFESTELLEKNTTKEVHRQNFTKFLANFKVRNKNDIPREMGICIPYGFIPDNGKTKLDIKQSLRWTDAPGVLYSIHTGDVQPGRFKLPAVEAAASAAVGTLGSTEEQRVKPFVTQRIGPRATKIGGLTAQQGGVALTVTMNDKKPYEAYSVFTGYSGWLGSAVLPYILIEMSTRSKEQAPELKDNPPPFKQSMDRLDTLLESTRLRPTTPTMPELSSLQKGR